MAKTVCRLMVLGLVGGVVAGAAHLPSSAVAGPVTLGKDQGPPSARCDHLKDSQTAWLNCVGGPGETASMSERFYAGYWLAKSGAYEAALRYLHAADQNDPRVLTYIGFSLRKLGDVHRALPYYTKALALDPNFNVARAYLGEAHLSQGDLTAAQSELSEIATRCGVNCAEHIDLARHIKNFKSRPRSNG